MLYPDQPTPPFNSPYQQHDNKSSTLLESSYQSHRTEVQPKFPDALGLYDYSVDNLPPSPQPSESWRSADPWESGAFQHPVSQSPLPWTSSHTSQRSSMSSYTREVSEFPHEGSERGFPNIKVEYSPWTPEIRYGGEEVHIMHGLSSPRPSSLTVAPEKLTASMYPYDSTYSTAPTQRYESSPAYVPKYETSPGYVPKYESSSGYEYSERDYERAPSEDSVSSFYSKGRSPLCTTSVPRERGRGRRHTDPSNAPYRCPMCPEKGFARRYNYNQHMLTHDTTRRRENICPYADCRKEFVRKTDLVRHDASVHRKVKPYMCTRCPQAFSRKDTLRRCVCSALIQYNC